MRADAGPGADADEGAESALEVAVVDEHEAWPEERHRERLDLHCSDLGICK